jgi:hypothetical protein
MKRPVRSIYSYYLVCDSIISNDNYISYPSQYYLKRQVRELSIDDPAEIFLIKYNNSKLTKDEI